MNLVGLDLNSTRARAVHGSPNGVPMSLPLEDGRAELPLALSLENKALEAGRAGCALCRQAPQLACLDFLKHLGDERTWQSQRNRLDANKALTHVFDKLTSRFGRFQGVASGIPTYLDENQRHIVGQLAGKARWK
ncbi:MAG: hypothetical protein ACRD36_11925, partial [Candidatus Acidiferrum sp.]